MGRSSREKRERRGVRPKREGFNILSTVQGLTHLLTDELASTSSVQSAKKYETAPDDIVRGALMVLIEDAVLVHRAALTLVANGYSGVAAANVRTLFDLAIAMVAILKSKKPKLTAFKYFYSGHWVLSRDDIRFGSEFRSKLREQVRERIRTLPAEDQEDAKNFCKDRSRDYFFSPEWKSPKEVLELANVPDQDYLYSKLSSAAHGGFWGLRLFRDDPDAREASPQLPPKEHALGLLLISSRLLLEMVILRGDHEGLLVAARARETIAKLRERYDLATTEPASLLTDEEHL